MRRSLILFFITASIALSAPQDELSYIKQKDEINALKKELTQFYNTKEAEYQKQKKELEQLLATIQKEKKETTELVKRNQEILKDIKGEVASKTAKIYNKMKPKVAAAILNQMMDEGKVEDVFDIILKLKEKNVTTLMKFLSVPNAATITEKLKNYHTK
ncbi:hypothetical protein [Candidatus Marinarcus aquaticus]|uniref:Magnesium transporter MgtE intracellular domain-containing protein n=1 Tax=Candidatus Marinarcus aquaticus TaxID=2044504 RepID=A0A4Q0XNV6_9BACT|nr:hypothetical protein [Candidatus Marinarcus aquaticus]RXJ56371.1 hypothetical protein CRV04_08115 [Candidatus Marinarcus aquaticus]